MNFNSYIKSLRQMHNTYITNDCPVKRDVYLELCDRFGIPPRKDVSAKNRGFLECVCVNNAFGVRVYFANKPELTSKELHLADLVDLHSSCVMTSDFEVARKFGEMVGLTLADHCDFVCVSCGDMNNIMRWTQSGIDTTHGALDGKTQLTPELINAMHAEMVKLKALNDAYATERASVELKDTKPVSLTEFLKRTKPMSSGEKFMQSNQAPVKVKSEFVLIEDDSIFDLRPDFEAGELFYKKDGNGSWCAIQNEKQLMEKLLSGQVYYRIEKPVDWVLEVANWLEVDDWSEDKNLGDIHNAFAGLRLDYFTESQFLEMCRVALRATGELPDTTK